MKITRRAAGIYKITNLVNNKFYIGSSSYIKARFGSHKYLLRHNKHPNLHLQSAWNLYGESNFNFEFLEVIENYNKDMLCEREQYFCDLMKPEYNLMKMVKSRLGHKESEEIKNKKRKYSKELILKIREEYKFLTISELSNKYNIPYSYIRGIVENRKWYDEDYIPKLSKEQVSKKISKPKINIIRVMNIETAELIREEYKSFKTSHAKLAKKYNVSTTMVHSIINNKIYINLPSNNTN